MSRKGLHMSLPTRTGQKINGYTPFTTDQLSPQQRSFFEQLLGGASQGSGQNLDWLNRIAQGDPSTYEALEAPGWRQFGEAQSQIANRFSGQGLGGRRGSDFKNAQSGAAQSFAENLQANRLNLRQDSIKQLLGLYENLIGQRTYDTGFAAPKQKKSSFWESILPIVGQVGGSLAGSFGGPIGTAAGSWVGKKLFGG